MGKKWTLTIIRPHFKSLGLTYKAFLKTLQPDFKRAQRDLIFGYAVLATILFVLCILPLNSWVFFILAIILGSLMIGYWLAFIQLFIHEAAHYNMAASKENNERIGDYAIGILVGAGIKDYRKIHFQHHRALGTTEDSENSYFFPVNLIMIGKMLFGIRALEVILNRKKIAKTKNRNAPPVSTILMLGLVLHISLLGIFLLFQEWAALFAWLLGVAIAFPFFAALR